MSRPDADRTVCHMRDANQAQGPARNAGGADRDRTGDPLLAKQVLSQLSYGPEKHCSCSLIELVGLKGWWAWVDLNYRPHAYQACALTN